MNEPNATAGAGGEPGATAAPTLRGDVPGPGGRRSYRLLHGPRHVTHDDRSGLPGHHEATFAPSDGEPFDRYLTDKGRAELLRSVDAGQHAFTSEELEWLTTEPTMAALLASMAEQGAEGA